MPGDLYTAPQDHFIIPLTISDRRYRRDTPGKWPLARNPDRNWWHRHTNLNLFWLQPMALWTVGCKYVYIHTYMYIYIYIYIYYYYYYYY